MACPLRVILNEDAASPQQLPDLPDTYDEGLAQTPADPRYGNVSGDQSSSQSTSGGTLPPLELWVSKSDLYNRRTRASRTCGSALPSPPQSSPPAMTVEIDSPSPAMDRQQFNIFTAILNYPELTFELAKCLHVEDLVSLYAISKDFHFIVNGHYTTIVLSQSMAHAPESSRIFLYKCYKSLCITDPAARRNLEIRDKLRCVPSFRWLRFVLYRESVVEEILDSLAAEGHHLPSRASSVLKKIWFMMDLGDNARRIGLIHNKDFWTNTDLRIATMFLIKLDMRLTDPVDGNGETSLRKMLLAQRSLSILSAALNRTGLLNELEMLQMYVRWKHRPAPHHQGMSIFGIPAHEVGKGQLEGWGIGSRRLLRPDELVMRECIRRRLNFDKRYLEMMSWGYVHSQTGQDVFSDRIDMDDDITQGPVDETEAASELSEEDEEDVDEVVQHEDIVIS